VDERGLGALKAGFVADLLPVEVVKTKNMKMSEINEAFAIACQHQAQLVKAWEEIHGND
jgi:hypothetical protein